MALQLATQEGWQYAQSFDDPDEKWTGERPPQLERVLTGNGASI